MQSLELSAEGQRLVRSLEQASAATPPQSHDTIHISGVGGNLYFAYEQLRNAAEYGERHLLVRRAIERFLRRTLRLRAASNTTEIARELISDLTHARYLENDSVGRSTVAAIAGIIDRNIKLADVLAQGHGLTLDRLSNWIYQAASVEIEHQLVPHANNDAYIEFVYNHYKQHIDEAVYGDATPEMAAIALYCAIHRTFFKSDISTTRYYAIAARLNLKGSDSLEYFVEINQAVDVFYQSPLTNKLARLVNRSGAPLRILREVVLVAGAPEQTLKNQSELMSRVGHEAQQQYILVRKRLNEGITRSVIFIFITKVILGLGIEVPYDLFKHGQVAWLPLSINTLFAPLYMATIGWGIRTPGQRNTEVIQAQLTRILYQTDDVPLSYRIRRRVTSPALTTAFNTVYAIAFLISFGLVVYALRQIGYNLVNGIIFFVFLSVVSFFGFRLLESARELEAVDQRKSLVSVGLDFFYTPFIRVGHWLSDKYSRLNLVTFVMDMAIELPLKTSLRVVQQWVGFIRDKQEEL